MGRSRTQAALLPPGLIIEQVRLDDAGLSARARSRATGAICPNCGLPSKQVHSRYARSLSDLPAHGRRVLVTLTVRRFRCTNGHCARRIFAERFGDDIVAPLRTGRRGCKASSIISASRSAAAPVRASPGAC
jgi:transposase